MSDFTTDSSSNEQSKSDDDDGGAGKPNLDGVESTDDEDDLKILVAPEQFALVEANMCALLFYHLLVGDLPTETNKQQCWHTAERMAKKLRRQSEQRQASVDFVGAYLATTDILSVCIKMVNKGSNCFISKDPSIFVCALFSTTKYSVRDFSAPGRFGAELLNFLE